MRKQSMFSKCVTIFNTNIAAPRAEVVAKLLGWVNEVAPEMSAGNVSHWAFVTFSMTFLNLNRK